MTAVAEMPEMRATSGSSQDQRNAVTAAGATDLQDLILSCNKDGMENLRKGQLKAAFEQFKYAEAILLANQTESDNTALLAVTCNNLGCYYKKVGKYHGALSYLRRALKMEVELKTDEVTLAGTHLNLCSVLSKLEKHDKAVQHALCALELMSTRVAGSDTAVSQDDYAVLAITYHNVATEREFLQQWDPAASAFQTGHQVAKRLLGENHPLSITLAKNSAAALTKARHSKEGKRKGCEGTPRDVEQTMLPPLDGLLPRAASTAPPFPKNPARSEATEWVRSEEALWSDFAQKALCTPGGDVAEPEGTLGDETAPEEGPRVAQNTLRPQPRTMVALRELQDFTQAIPEAHDRAPFVCQSPKAFLKKTPLGQALDDHPAALMDIIDADGDGHSSHRSAPNDFRPNRSMKRSTRTSRVVRRTGVFNSTTYRDRVAADMQKKLAAQGTRWTSVHTQKLAAERIQRVWRMWYQYCQEHAEWMTITWICATMIQSHWRSYHVRRQKMDHYASIIQRHFRGFLVRFVLKQHTAAVTIQRRVIGMLTRMKLRRLHAAATDIQRLVRGGIARRHFRELKRVRIMVAVAIQRHMRVLIAKRIATKLHEEKHTQALINSATLNLQRLFRGWKGRQVADERRTVFLEAKLMYDAATKLQTMFRRRRALRQVDALRDLRLGEMDKAATFVQKVWLGARMRKKYLAVRETFASSEDSIVTIQRYTRGCMCRLRMWREAVRTEEELWAAIEIQRRWCGYRGRVRWEDEFEIVWRRELSAAVLQRNVRGWLARVQVNRIRRRRARAEFERARQRFRAAQRIQAVARGMLTRQVTQQHWARVVKAAVTIQKIQRGRALRSKVWSKAVNQKATMITAVARGFLIRKHRLGLIAKVILIQRSYRRWLKHTPKEEREKHCAHTQRRKSQAAKIQRQFRHFMVRKEIKRIIEAPLCGHAACAA